MKYPWNLNRALIVFGAALILLAFVWVVAPAPDNAGMAMPLAIGAVLGGAAIAFYAPAWMYLVAAFLVATFPLVVIFVFGAIAALEHPGGGYETGALILVLAGAVAALVGGIWGFAQARKGTAPRVGAAMGAPQGAFVGLIVALLVGMILSNALVSKDVRAAAESPNWVIEAPDATASLHTTDFAFAPRDLKLAANTLTDITIRNDDAAFHTLSFRHGGMIHTTLIPAESELHLPLKFAVAGTIPFWCDPHSGGEGDTSAESMVGTFVVE